MFSNTRSTLAIAFAATILGASPALAEPGGDDLRGENAAALSEHPSRRRRRARICAARTPSACRTPGPRPRTTSAARTPASRSAGRASRSRSWSR